MRVTDSARRVAVLVHELRSPVAALTAIATAVREADGPAREQLVGLALAACEAIDRLVTDVTVASVRPADTDVSAIVRDAAAALALAGGGVDVQVYTEASPLIVRADSVRLRQALDNLLTNALVHGDADVVEISARRAGATIVVSVRDTGPGIASDDLERIFEAGVRLAGGGHGSGLGLAITKAIVDAHGGSIEVVSAPGEGSTFTIVLPSGDRHPDT